MIKKDIQKWTKALRSGKYKQSKHSLQNKDGYCCLGVACEVFVENYNRCENGYLSGGTPLLSNGAPFFLIELQGDFSIKTETDFIELNDRGDFTFDEIADMIETVYIHKILD